MARGAKVMASKGPRGTDKCRSGVTFRMGKPVLTSLIGARRTIISCSTSNGLASFGPRSDGGAKAMGTRILARKGVCGRVVGRVGGSNGNRAV